MSYHIRLKPTSKINVRTKYVGQTMAQRLNDLSDVQISGDNDKYVLMYDSVTGKWRDVNPDDILIASASAETTQPGLPTDFINTLDVTLDNKIDLDAGNF